MQVSRPDWFYQLNNLLIWTHLDQVCRMLSCLIWTGSSHIAGAQIWFVFLSGCRATKWYKEKTVNPWRANGLMRHGWRQVEGGEGGRGALRCFSSTEEPLRTITSTCLVPLNRRETGDAGGLSSCRFLSSWMLMDRETWRLSDHHQLKVRTELGTHWLHWFCCYCDCCINETSVTKNGCAKRMWMDLL